MILEFNTESMSHKVFNPSPEREGKGWSYSFVYYLNDLKAIYLILQNVNCPISVPELLTICIEEKVESESGKKWTNRNLLEILNALKNFDLIDKSSNVPIAGNLFTTDSMGLTEKDKNIFRKIYKSYFRFTDFHKIFASINDTPAIVYAFKEGQRFFNRFVRVDKNELYYIESSHQDTMRFWDVYTKWGESLGELNKCLVSSFGIQIINPVFKNIYVYNLTSSIPKDFSICEYIQNKMYGTSYYIPDIEWSLIKEYGFSIEEIKKCILNELALNNTFRLQKASFLTVEPDELKLFPVVNNTFMSHILKII